MSTIFLRDLESYNRFILQFQDRAYTLAVYLRGENPLVESILQEVFRKSFSLWERSGEQGPAFETKLLRAVIQRCRQAGPVIGPDSLHEFFKTLSCDEKLALILVDCLACSIPEAALVLAWPLDELRRTLASARLKITPRLQTQVTG